MILPTLQKKLCMSADWIRAMHGIYVYSGSIPDDPLAPLTGTLLAVPKNQPNSFRGHIDDRISRAEHEINRARQVEDFYIDGPILQAALVDDPFTAGFLYYFGVGTQYNSNWGVDEVEVELEIISSGTAGYIAFGAEIQHTFYLCSAGVANEEIKLSSAVFIPYISSCEIYSGSPPASDLELPTGDILLDVGAIDWGATVGCIGLFTGVAGYARLSHDSVNYVYCSVGIDNNSYLKLSSLGITEGSNVNVTVCATSNKVSIIECHTQMVFPS